MLRQNVPRQYATFQKCLVIVKIRPTLKDALLLVGHQSLLLKDTLISGALTPLFFALSFYHNPFKIHMGLNTYKLYLNIFVGDNHSIA